MMRYGFFLLLVIAASACKKEKAADIIREPIEVDAAEQVAFIKQAGISGEYQLFIMQADGSNLHPLSPANISNEPVAVSHDGNKFAYSVYDKNRTGGLYVIDKRGGEPVLLDSSRAFYSSMSWSPDDRKILFLQQVLDTMVRSNVFVIEANGKNKQQLTTDGKNFYPYWFPDGNSILYNSAGSDPGVHIMDKEGNGKKRIGLAGMAYSNAVISPAGDKIAMAFESIANERSLLYVMNADGSSLKQIMAMPAATPAFTSSYYRSVFVSPSWSPDGSKIAYAARVDNNADLFVINSDGSDNTRLAKTDKWESNPCWTKDGKNIIYLASDESDPNTQIYITGADGRSVALQLTQQGYHMYPVSIAH